MANQVNIIEQCNTTVQVTDQVKEVVQVVTLGPQGPMGPKGDVPDGFNEFTASFNHFTASYNTGSFTGSFYGQVYGSASYATTASWAAYAANVPETASFAVSSSYAVSTSFANSSEYPIKATGSFSLYGPGAGAQASTANAILLGNLAGNIAAHANGAVMLGASAGGSMRSGSNSVVIGTQAGEFSTYARSAVFLGNQAGRGATYASYSVMIGELAGSNSEPLAYSVVLGYAAGASIFGALASTRYSNFIGYAAGLSALSSSYSNFFGYYAGYGAQSSMFSNFIGYKAGYSEGSTWPGSNTTIIGTNISLDQNLNNYVNLGAVLFISGTYSNTSVDSPFTGSNNGRVGINTTLPAYSLDVSGSGRFTGPLLANDLTGSLYGTASWALNVVGLSATSSYALTASYAPAYLPLTGGTITGDIQVLGTASIAFLNVTYESSSVIYSSGSNQLGDSELDFQRLYGTVTVVTGSMNAPIFSGSGANLFNIPASAVTGLSTSQINTGSVVAKVDTGTGSFALSSGSSTFLFVSSSGNVGIGTTSPIASIETYSNSIYIAGAFSMYSNTATDEPIFYFRRGRGSLTSPTVISAGDTIGSLRFAAQFTATVGSYNTNAKIESVAEASGANLRFYTNTGGFSTSPTLKLQINGNGNTIIQNGGTFTDDGQRLQVVGSAKITSGLTVSGSGGSAYALTTTNGWVQFGSTSGFIWDNTNNRVGIGTNSPSFVLDIAGYTDGILRQHIKNSSNGASAQTAILLRNDADMQYMFGITSTGYSPANGLQLGDAFVQMNNITPGTYTSSSLVLRTTNDNAIKLQTNSITRMVIYASGNITMQGSGSFVDNGYRLELNGSGSASGSLRVVSGSSMFNGDMIISGSARVRDTMYLTSVSANAVGGDITFNNRLLVNNIGPASGNTIAIANGSLLNLNSGGPQGAVTRLNLDTTWQFSSGTANGRGFVDSVTVNVTSTGTGTYNSFIAAPTITSLASASYRAFQWNNNSGWGLYGSGSAASYLSGNLSIGTTVTGSALTVYKSGSTVVDVQGSTGQLFSVVDSMTGSLMSVNDISGIPLLSVNSNGAMYVNSATQNSVTGSFTVYSIDSTSGNAAYFDYRVFNPITSGSRAGTVMAVWFGSSVEATDTSTNDLIADTSGISFSADVSSSFLRVNATVTTGSWNVKIGARVI